MRKTVMVLAVLLAGVMLTNAQNSVSFDNQSGEPALVKLIGPTSNEIEVPDGTKQALQVLAGKYLIKVRYGVQGKFHYTKGQEFTVEETATTTSAITITLHRVVNGNYESTPISEQEFSAGNFTDLGASNKTTLHTLAKQDKQKVLDALVFLNRSQMDINRGDIDSAIADANKALDIKPDYAEAYCNRASAKRAKNDIDGAIADCTKAIELKPDLAAAYCNRGAAKTDKHDWDGAIADITKAIQIDPTSSNFYFVRGLAKQLSHDLDGAIADYSDAIKHQPNLAIAYRYRAIAKEAKGDVDGANIDRAKAQGLR
jgi:tetratricopeptide (TPR) repeat protein